jgi:hypothetical protein
MRWASSPDWLPDWSEDARHALREFGEPIVGLAAAIQPAPGRLITWGRRNGGVVTVMIIYTVPRPFGPWAMVELSHGAGTGRGSLRAAIRRYMRGDGEDLTGVEFAHGNATIILDGQPVPAETVRAGTHWWAAQCGRDAVEIRILAHKWDPGQVRLDTVTDIESLLGRQGLLLTSGAEPWESEIPGDEPQGEPHRALAELVLQSSVGFVPGIRNWYRFWRAAVRRQMDLADQTAQQAEYAVQSVMSHLGALQQQAAWFRGDDRLRERAIAETLLSCTGLGPHVPSRPAQVAWQRLHDTSRASAWPRPEVYVAASEEWIRAWTTWAERAA